MNSGARQRARARTQGADLERGQGGEAQMQLADVAVHAGATR